jgi:hypothetical protein
MLSNKSIQRLYKPSRLRKFPVVKKLIAPNDNQTPSESAANDTHLSRDQVIEIYDWIAQFKSQSKDA